jgi:FkbH-like protein
MRIPLVPGWQDQTLKLSRYLHHLELETGEHLLTHGIYGHPFRVTDSAWQALATFEEPRTLADAASDVGMPLERLKRAVETLMGRGLIVPADLDEERAARAHFVYAGQTRRVHQPALVGGALPTLDLASLVGDRVPVRVLVLGACFARGVEALLVEHGAAVGFDLDITVSSIEGLPLVEQLRPDVVVFQMPGSLMLRPLLDHFATLSAEEVTELFQAFMGYVEQAFERLEALAGNALVLVHGYYVPQFSPLGAREYRAEVGFFEVIRAANQGILDAARKRERFHFIDEDRLFGAYGKRRVQDDHLHLYSHHGALDYAERTVGKPQDHEPSVYESFDLSESAAAERLLVDEYLTIMRVHLAPRPVKCVVVDLDGTLWPGAIGDEGFDLASVLPHLTQYRHAGLHQALKILKSRGVLLAIASKNNPEDVMARWHYPLTGRAPSPGSPEERQVLSQMYKQLYSPEGEGIFRANERSVLMHMHLLQPEDFVTTRIGWEPKSEMLRSIAAELNLGLEQVAFIDDSPTERAEVHHHLPEVWVLDGDPNRWRETLLSVHRFQVAELTVEATRRTELTRAQLHREAARRMDASSTDFLRTLGLEASIRLEQDESAFTRIHELLARTNQMNLTTRRHDLVALRRFLDEPGSRVYTLSARDRFTDYGLVGAAIVAGDELDSFVLSCRVMGLELEDVFLRTILLHDAPKVATYIPTGRNGPCAALLPTNGFQQVLKGELESSVHFEYPPNGACPEPPIHCRVSVEGF